MALKGKHPWNYHKKTGIKPWLGKKRSEEDKQKMRKPHKCGWKHSDVSRKKISIGNKGKKKSKDAVKKMTESMKLRYKNHPELLIKMKEISSRYIGENAHNWKGGVTKIDKLVRNLEEYKQWRSDCFERDKWTCQSCGFRGGYVTVHHIKSLHRIIVDNDIKNIQEARQCNELWDINNGVTLCEHCHSLTDNYKGRGSLKKLNI